MDEPRANTDSQDLPRPRLGRSCHLPPYSIFCAWPWGLYSNVIRKFLRLGFPRLCGPIISSAHLQLKRSLKQSCSPFRELLNNMSHTTYTQVNQGDFRLLVVKSQIGSLTLDPSFGHNLCLKYPCKLILDIMFEELYKNIMKSSIDWFMTLAIALWKLESPSGLQLPKWEFTWECGCSFLHTLLNSWEHQMWLLGFTLGLHLYKPLLWLWAWG
jgi:hypothetical protein